jgi:hypothetical protein
LGFITIFYENQWAAETPRQEKGPSSGLFPNENEKNGLHETAEAQGQLSLMTT